MGRGKVALQRSAASRADAPVSFITHLLAIPKLPPQRKGQTDSILKLELQPRKLDF